MTLPLIPTSDLVVIAWLRTCANLDAGQVASTLPALPETGEGWGPAGFVQARTVSGARDIHLPVGRPVVQVDAWAVKTATGRPLWNVANLLCEHIIAATRDEATLRRLLTLPDDYPDARVLECYPLVEPHRIEGDAGSFARFQFDLQFHWVAA